MIFTGGWEIAFYICVIIIMILIGCMAFLILAETMGDIIAIRSSKWSDFVYFQAGDYLHIIMRLMFCTGLILVIIVSLGLMTGGILGG